MGALSSRFQLVWATKTGATLEDRPTYITTRCFDPFPFPDANNIQKQTIRVIAEELDAHRKRVLSEHPHLTLTGLYNVLERLRAGAVPQAQPSPAGLTRGSTPSRGAAKKDVDGRVKPGHDGAEMALTPEEQRIFDDGSPSALPRRWITGASPVMPAWVGQGR
jgi:hypothetical protein